MISILPQHPYIEKLVLFGSTLQKHDKVTLFQDIIRGRLCIKFDFE